MDAADARVRRIAGVSLLTLYVLPATALVVWFCWLRTEFPAWQQVLGLLGIVLLAALSIKLVTLFVWLSVLVIGTTLIVLLVGLVLSIISSQLADQWIASLLHLADRAEALIFTFVVVAPFLVFAIFDRMVRLSELIERLPSAWLLVPSPLRDMGGAMADEPPSEKYGWRLGWTSYLQALATPRIRAWRTLNTFCALPALVVAATILQGRAWWQRSRSSAPSR